MLKSDGGVLLADWLQVLGTPIVVPSFLSVQVFERTGGIVVLEIPDEEQEVRIFL